MTFKVENSLFSCFFLSNFATFFLETVHLNLNMNAYVSLNIIKDVILKILLKNIQKKKTSRDFKIAKKLLKN